MKRPHTMPSGRLCLYLFLTGLALTFQVRGATAAAPSLFADHYGTVALDPGHGGKDLGAKGPEGTFEKAICLALTRRITTLMEPKYRIVLTRSEDYDVQLQERTAIANNQNADLLVSIHTAAGFLHAAAGGAIYYFQPTVKESAELSPQGDSQNAALWQNIQTPHINASRTLATLLQQTIKTIPGGPDFHVLHAPLVVLEGADMPAVLIEVGCLTNPDDEKSLNSEGYQDALAQAIAKGIESYLAKVRITRRSNGYSR